MYAGVAKGRQPYFLLISEKPLGCYFLYENHLPKRGKASIEADAAAYTPKMM